MNLSRHFGWLAALLCAFVLLEVNYPLLAPQTQLALFALLGLVLVFLQRPTVPWADLPVVLAGLLCFGYIAVQSEPFFQAWWFREQSLGNRAGAEVWVDYLAGLVGVLLVLEGARRAVGWALPLLALSFLLYAAWGNLMPEWLFPHRGYGWQRIVGQTFLHSQGVFGVALRVMFTYVFLFVLFGSLLESCGATGYVLALARRLFRNSPGGAAKVAVLASGALGSLSGSAVANTATTGTFTIPMMRSAGFSPALAAGIEAAASSGGALVPPIMGAGAYMMLELVDPPVSYLQIVQAALIPAALYYVALLMTVHLRARSLGLRPIEDENVAPPPLVQGLLFAGAFALLVVLLVVGYTPFRAVSLSMLAVVLLGALHPRTRMGPAVLWAAVSKAVGGGSALIAAAACVGLILGVVTLTGLGSKLPGMLLPLAQDNLLLALFLLMVSSLILGLGLPSAVCYLLVATLVGPALGQLGAVPLAAHFFVFYFGMMAMVTPPVALAAYTAAALAGAGVMAAGLAAFRFALVGFALPYAFVLHPELLLLGPDGGPVAVSAVLWALLQALVAIVPLAAATAGGMFAPLGGVLRLLLLAAALVLLLARQPPLLVVAGLVVLGIFMHNRKRAVEV